MKRLSIATLVLGMGLAGCAAPGKWTLETVDPEAKRGQFQPHVLTLQKDQTYYADTEHAVTAGTWEWQGPISNGLLVLDPRPGGGAGSASYKASMPNNCKLVLETDVGGEPVTAKFTREE